MPAALCGPAAFKYIKLFVLKTKFHDWSKIPAEATRAYYLSIKNLLKFIYKVYIEMCVRRTKNENCSNTAIE